MQEIWAFVENNDLTEVSCEGLENAPKTLVNAFQALVKAYKVLLKPIQQNLGVGKESTLNINKVLGGGDGEIQRMSKAALGMG